MSKACKCDICGKLFNDRMATPDLTIERYRHPYGSERLDLCDECQTKLEQFVNGVNNVDAKTEIVYCKDCKYLDIEDSGMYATCAKAYKGIIHPYDSCKKGIKKNIKT